jgi:hypothetical protein
MFVDWFVVRSHKVDKEVRFVGVIFEAIEVYGTCLVVSYINIHIII